MNCKQSIEQNQVEMLAWNIQSGGFLTYDPNSTNPERGPKIQRAISTIRNQHTTNTICLTDAYRWDEVYGGDSGIATHIGTREARFIRLQDDRLDRKIGAGVGIAFGTNHTIESSRALDLDTRQGLGVILDVGKYGLQIANVYLDDMSEEVRINSIRALVNELEPDMPTILVGDFNALRPDMKGASFSNKAKNIAVKSLAIALSKRSPLGIAVTEMNKRTAIPLIESYGFQDADSLKKMPTAPARLPIFGVDYVFSNGLVNISDYRVHPDTGASDHRPLTFTASTAG